MVPGVPRGLELSRGQGGNVLKSLPTMAGVGENDNLESVVSYRVK